MEDINMKDIKESVGKFVDEAAEKAAEAADNIEKAAGEYAEKAAAAAEDFKDEVEAKAEESAEKIDEACEGFCEETGNPNFEIPVEELKEGLREAGVKVKAGLKSHGIDTDILGSKLAEDASYIAGKVVEVAKAGASVAADALDTAAAALRPKDEIGSVIPIDIDAFAEDVNDAINEMEQDAENFGEEAEELVEEAEELVEEADE